MSDRRFSSEQDCLAAETKERLNPTDQRGFHPNGANRDEIRNACVMLISCNFFYP